MLAPSLRARVLLLADKTGVALRFLYKLGGSTLFRSDFFAPVFFVFLTILVQ